MTEEDEGAEAASRLAVALERIAASARRARPEPSGQPSVDRAVLAERLDRLIATVRAALGPQA